MGPAAGPGTSPHTLYGDTPELALQQMGAQGGAAASGSPTRGRSAEWVRPHRHAIEVLGSHLDPHQHELPDRSIYTAFIRKLSPPRIRTAGHPSLGTHSQQGADRPAPSPPDGQSTIELQEAGEIDPPHPATADNEPTPDQSQAQAAGGLSSELPLLQPTAVGEPQIAEPSVAAPSPGVSDMASGGDDKPAPAAGQAQAATRQHKQTKQAPFKEAALQLQPNFPGHKLGSKAHEEGLQAGLAAAAQKSVDAHDEAGDPP